MENKPTSHVTKGLIIALFFIVLDLVAQFAGFKFDTWYSWTSSLLMIAAFAWAAISFANQMNNRVTFGNAFAHGFKTSAVVACIMFVYAILLVYVISPEMIDQMMEKELEKAAAQGKDVSEGMEGNEDLVKKIVKVTMLAGTLIGTLIVGCIGSLIGAAIARKNPPTPFQTNA